jgi:hypothetical protein
MEPKKTILVTGASQRIGAGLVTLFWSADITSLRPRDPLPRRVRLGISASFYLSTATSVLQ